jgi:hypothetical protein
MDNESNDKSLRREATSAPTLQQQQQVATALPDHVKDLGRKARARLQEGRDNRPEIVRLEAAPSEKGTAKKAGSFFRSPLARNIARKKPTEKVATLKKRKRRTPKPSRTAVDKDVDRWIPDIHGLQICSRENRSNVVRLHGLPEGTTPELVRRFFSGLDPQRIFILPSNPIYIPEWDANHGNIRKKAGTRVERYDADFRVYVKFHAAPTAELAAGRSGEIIFLTDNEDGDESHTGASIGVTQIVKTTATYLIRHMAVDGETGVPLEETLENFDRLLDPLVSNILWTTAMRELNLDVEYAVNDRSFDSSPLPASRIGDHSSKSGNTNELASRRQSLVKRRDLLLNQSPFPSAELLDPALAGDPIIHLTAGAVQCLRREIERIDDRVQEARRWTLFGRAKVSSAAQRDV